jgi:hypothetical protein
LGLVSGPVGDVGEVFSNLERRAMMKIIQISLLVFLYFGMSAGMSYARAAGETAAQALSSEQLKKEREAFIKIHQYDPVSENWILKEEVEPPANMKTRAQVRAEREEFVKLNKYDTVNDSWVLLKGEPKPTMTRAQVRAETRQFLRDYTWDDMSGSWLENRGEIFFPRK